MWIKKVKMRKHDVKRLKDVSIPDGRIVASNELRLSKDYSVCKYVSHRLDHNLLCLMIRLWPILFG